jgi:ABC-type antimicrobial peptide transport system permease subunit
MFVEVVGVVGDVHYGSLAQAVDPIIYLPLAQNLKRRMSILVRSQGDPLASFGPVRDAVHGFDPDMPLFGVAPVAQIVESSLWQERLFATLLSLFGALALILAAVGLYGVIAYLVSESRREIGIRVAVGASGIGVVTHFLERSLRLVAAAIALGLVGSLAAGRLLAGTLHGVSALDPMVALGVLAVLLVIAAIATVVPARAAARVDPVEALRTEG